MDEQYTMVGIGSAEHTIHGVMVSAIFTISYKESDSFSPSVEEAPLPISSSSLFIFYYFIFYYFI